MSAGQQVRCKKCGDVIQSQHRHDLVWCKCKSIYVDGGGEYLRVGWPEGNPDDWLEVIETKEEC